MAHKIFNFKVCPNNYGITAVMSQKINLIFYLKKLRRTHIYKVKIKRKRKCDTIVIEIREKLFNKKSSYKIN